MKKAFRSYSHKSAPIRRRRSAKTACAPGCVYLLLVGAALVAGCDHGLEPPDAPAVGTIQGTVEYDTTSWPPRSAVLDLRFVALPFVPQDSADLFRDLNALVFTPAPLAYGVAADTFVIANVPATTYVYNGVAEKFGPDLLDWRPVGLYESNGGLFSVRADETTAVYVFVDFDNRPPFPPPPP